MENKEGSVFKEQKEIRTSRKLAESLGFTRLSLEKPTSSDRTFFKKIDDNFYEKLFFYDVGLTGGGPRTERVVLGVLMGNIDEEGKGIGWSKEYDLLSLEGKTKELDKYRSKLDDKLLQEFDKNKLKEGGYNEIGNLIRELEGNNWFKKELNVIKEKYKFGRELMNHIAFKFKEKFPDFIYDDKVRERNTSDIFFFKPPREGDKKTSVLRFYRWGKRLLVAYKKATFFGDVNDPKNIKVNFNDYVTGRSEDTVWYPAKSLHEEVSNLSELLKDTNDSEAKKMFKSINEKMFDSLIIIDGLYLWENRNLKRLKNVFNEEGLNEIGEYLIKRKIVKRKEVNK